MFAPPPAGSDDPNLPRTTPLNGFSPHTARTAPTLVGEVTPFASGSVTLRSSNPAAPRPLPLIPGYELIRELGSGGMGVVYLAQQLRVGRPVALKMLRAGVLADDEVLARFAEEARIIARLRHRHIVQLYEFNSEPHLPYVTLEYIEGPTLAQYLNGKPQSPEWAAAMVEQLARAMQYAHEQGVVHRDLKPANVLLASGGCPPSESSSHSGSGNSSHALEPKITDFGLAKILGDSPFQTATGYASGTPGYMAPEQIRGDRDELGPWTDVYALGVILYECLTGQAPFRGSNPAAIMLATTVSEPPAPGKLWRDIPRDLETICLKCLAKKPAERYLTAAALAADLARFREGRPISARRAGVAERVWKFTRRNPVVAGLAAALLATVVIGFVATGLLYLQAEDRRRQAEAALAAAEHAGQQEAVARAAAEQAADHARLAERAAAAALAELTARQTDLEAVNTFVLEDILAAPRPAGFIPGKPAIVTLREALDAAAARIDTRFGDKPALAAAAEYVVGESYRQLGEYQPATQHLARAVELREKHTPQDHVGLNKSWRALALVLSQTGKLNEAITLHRRVLANLEKHPNAVFEALVRRDLGLCLVRVGDSAGALEMFNQAHSILMSAFGPDHFQTLNLLTCMAKVHNQAGRYDLAIAISRDTAARAEATHGPDAMITGYALAQLGVALGHIDVPAAEEPLRRALAIHSRIAGPNHPDTLHLTAAYGTILMRLSKFTDAEQLLRPAAKVAPTVLGPDQANTLLIRRAFIQCLIDGKKWDEAEVLLAELVEDYRKYRPADVSSVERSLAKVRQMKSALPVAPPPRLK